MVCVVGHAYNQSRLLKNDVKFPKRLPRATAMFVALCLLVWALSAGLFVSSIESRNETKDAFIGMQTNNTLLLE